MDALTDSAANALCGLAQKALEEKGVDPILAAAFAERACRPLARRGIRAAGRAAKSVGGKVKRKASKYNKEYAKQYKKLKKKHPRSAFKVLAKKAHRATKKVMK
jgi:predicted Fe-Mo cluster-binding NifX family protein